MNDPLENSIKEVEIYLNQLLQWQKERYYYDLGSPDHWGYKAEAVEKCLSILKSKRPLS